MGRHGGEKDGMSPFFGEGRRTAVAVDFIARRFYGSTHGCVVRPGTRGALMQQDIRAARERQQ